MIGKAYDRTRLLGLSYVALLRGANNPGLLCKRTLRGEFFRLTLMLTEEEILKLESALGRSFANKQYLLDALTRRSYWHEHRGDCDSHNERLEFLGDAVLGLVIADVLYREFPDDEEGELQKKRASLVNRAALARLMRQLDIASYLRMGKGDAKSGGRENDSILSDTLEALIAAAYLDGGFSEAKKMIEKHFYPMIQRCSTRDGLDDFKSALQERCQFETGYTPTYKVLEEWGQEHDKTFKIAVFISGRLIGEGEGPNKREAAQKAAKSALEKIEEGELQFR